MIAPASRNTAGSPTARRPLGASGVRPFVLLPGGPAIFNSTEILTSPNMLVLVEELKHRAHRGS